MNDIPTLVLTCPDYAVTALRWVCEKFIGRELDAGFVVRPDEELDTIKIEFACKAITMNNVFFRENPFCDGKAPLLPPPERETFVQPVHASPKVNPLPILFGGNEYAVSPDGLHLGIDVLGGMFYLASRYEERFAGRKDLHDRFPASQSTLHRHGCLNRPLADEYVRLLCDLIQQVWPQIARRKHVSQICVTCDVDAPYEATITNWRKWLWKCGGDLLKRRSVPGIKSSVENYWRSNIGDYSADPNNTFDWIMDVNEKAGNRVAFYFLVDQSVPKFDAHYSIDEPRIRALMRRIHDRGHEIGLHASYGTYRNPVQMKKEADKLRQVMDEEGIKQDEIGSRQHYLRWSTPETARHLEAAGIAYDTTLGYADHAGFRCGTCHEYPMFDVERQQILNLRQRPLILMEASVLSQRYMNMGYSDDTLDYMKRLKATCHEHGGTFTLLWHNSHLRTENDRRFYQELIA